MMPPDMKPYPGPRAMRPHAPYTVQPGDNIFTVACWYGDVDPQSILNANGLSSPNDIHVGQVLIIPVGVVSVTATSFSNNIYQQPTRKANLPTAVTPKVRIVLVDPTPAPIIYSPEIIIAPVFTSTSVPPSYSPPPTDTPIPPTYPLPPTDILTEIVILPSFTAPPSPIPPDIITEMPSYNFTPTTEPSTVTPVWPTETVIPPSPLPPDLQEDKPPIFNPPADTAISPSPLPPNIITEMPQPFFTPTVTSQNWVLSLTEVSRSPVFLKYLLQVPNFWRTPIFISTPTFTPTPIP